MGTIRYGVWSAALLLAGAVLVNAAGVSAAPSAGSGEVAREAGSGPEERVIFKIREKVDRRSERAVQVLQRVSARLGRQLEPLRTLATGALVAELPAGAAMEEVVAELAGQVEVEYAEPDLLMQPMLVPNDTRYYEQWNYFDPLGGMNLPYAWDINRGMGVTVAVLDTGYRPHADLSANLLPGYDMISSSFIGNDGNGRDADARDPGDWANAGECGNGQPSSNRASSWHGTHVSGTVAAVSDNGAGVAGVANQSKLLPVRVLGKCGGYTSDIVDGLLWSAGLAVTGVPANTTPAKVINLSLGSVGACSTTFQQGIDRARAAGAVVVAAAGNSSADASGFSPAGCSGVITVAATDRKGARSYFSNYGNVVALSAPGGDMRSSGSNGILSLLNSGSAGPGSDSFAFYQGTSMAAPHVSGLAALLYSADPAMTPDRVRQVLTGTARAFPGTCTGCGAGIADGGAALAAVTGGGSRDGGPLQNGAVQTGLSGAVGSEITFTLQVPAGATNLNFRLSGGTGDADLYIRFGARPTTASYDYRPALKGNEESVRIDSVQGGTWHVMVRGSAAFSGVTLSAGYTEPPPSGATCGTGFTGYTNSLAGAGNSRYEPNGSYYFSSRSGTHSGRLSGPSTSNFDLVLVKWTGSRWGDVARSALPGSTESIDYKGTSGYYSWRVESRSGGGIYNLCLAPPR